MALDVRALLGARRTPVIGPHTLYGSAGPEYVSVRESASPAQHRNTRTSRMSTGNTGASSEAPRSRRWSLRGRTMPVRFPMMTCPSARSSCTHPALFGLRRRSVSASLLTDAAKTSEFPRSSSQRCMLCTSNFWLLLRFRISVFGDVETEALRVRGGLYPGEGLGKFSRGIVVRGEAGHRLSQVCVRGSVYITTVHHGQRPDAHVVSFCWCQGFSLSARAAISRRYF